MSDSVQSKEHRETAQRNDEGHVVEDGAVLDLHDGCVLRVMQCLPVCDCVKLCSCSSGMEVLAKKYLDQIAFRDLLPSPGDICSITGGLHNDSGHDGCLSRHTVASCAASVRSASTWSDYSRKSSDDASSVVPERHTPGAFDIPSPQSSREVFTNQFGKSNRSFCPFERYKRLHNLDVTGWWAVTGSFTGGTGYKYHMHLEEVNHRRGNRRLEKFVRGRVGSGPSEGRMLIAGKLEGDMLLLHEVVMSSNWWRLRCDVVNICSASISLDGNFMSGIWIQQLIRDTNGMYGTSHPFHYRMTDSGSFEARKVSSSDAPDDFDFMSEHEHPSTSRESQSETSSSGTTTTADRVRPTSSNTHEPAPGTMLFDRPNLSSTATGPRHSCFSIHSFPWEAR